MCSTSAQRCGGEDLTIFPNQFTGFSSLAEGRESSRGSIVAAINILTEIWSLLSVQAPLYDLICWSIYLLLSLLLRPPPLSPLSPSCPFENINEVIIIICELCWLLTTDEGVAPVAGGTVTIITSCRYTGCCMNIQCLLSPVQIYSAWTIEHYCDHYQLVRDKQVVLQMLQRCMCITVTIIT